MSPPSRGTKPTGVHTDPQVFRAVKGIYDELQESKRQAAAAHGALKQEVTALDKKVDTLAGKLDDVMVATATVSGKMDVMLATRTRSPSSETRMVVREQLAEQVLAEQKAERDHSRAVRLKIIGGVIGVLTSGAVIGAFIHWVAS